MTTDRTTVITIDLEAPNLQATLAGWQQLNTSIGQTSAAAASATASLKSGLGDYVPVVQSASVGQAQFAASVGDSRAKLDDFVPTVAKAQAAQKAHHDEVTSGTLKFGDFGKVVTDVAGQAIPGLSASVSSATGLMRTLGEETDGMAGKLSLAGAGIAGLGVAIAGISFEQFDVGLESLKRLSEQTGLTIPAVQGLQSAMQAQGVSADSAGQMLARMSMNLETMQQQADKGQAPTGRMASALFDLGINAQNSQGQMLPLSGLLPQIADAFQQQAQRAQESGQSFNAAGTAIDLFGRSGAQMVPFLLQGSAGMAEYTEKAKAAGIGTEEQVAHLESFKKASADAGLQAKAFAINLGSDVAPAFTEAASKGGDFLQMLNSLPSPVRDLAIGLPLATGAGLATAAMMMKVVDVAAPMVDTAVRTAQGWLSASTAAETLSVSEATLATTEEATAAASVEAGAAAEEASFSFAAAAGPIGLIVGGLTAVGGILLSVTGALHDHTAATDADTAATQRSLGGVQAQIQAWKDAGVTGDNLLLKIAQQMSATNQSAADWQNWSDAYGNVVRQQNAGAVATADATSLEQKYSQELGLTGQQLTTTATNTDKLNQLVEKASRSTQDQAAFERDYADALKVAALSKDDFTTREQKLQDLITNSAGPNKQYYQDQYDIDQIVRQLTPDVANEAKSQAELNDAMSRTKPLAEDVVTTLGQVALAFRDGKVDADKYSQALADAFSKPTQQELALRQQIDQNRIAISQWQAQLANSSPIDQHIAKLVEQQDQEAKTGASVDQQKKTAAELQQQLALVPAQEGDNIVARQHTIDTLGDTQTALTTQQRFLQDERTAAKDAADMNTEHAAPSLEAIAKAANGPTGANASLGDTVTKFQALIKNNPTDALAGLPGQLSAIGGAASVTNTQLDHMLNDMLQLAGIKLPTGAAGIAIPGISSAGSGSGFGMPVAGGPVTQGYGPTDETAEPAAHGAAHFHEGIDYGVPEGTSVKAVGAGKVIAAGYGVVSPGQGNSVVIDLGNGFTSIESHLSKIDVNTGDMVTKGQEVGLSGNTGTATTGPHLHFQLDLNGTDVDPNQYLGGQAGAAATAGGPIPASWLAAIQGHESTLPLPGPGSPEPMFGIIPEAAGGYSVGEKTYTSGGTAAASASIGAAPGTTRQALFPSVDAGVAAFTAIVSKMPGAMEAAQRGDFAGFLSALVAGGYAGPGEGGPFESQVLAAYNPNATLSGLGASSLGTPGQLPAPAPSTNASTAPPTAAASNLDVATADKNLSGLTDRFNSLEEALGTIQGSPAIPQLAAETADFAAKMAPIPGLYADVAARTAQYNADVQSGTMSVKDLKQEHDDLAASQDRLTTAMGEADTASKTLTHDQQVYDAQTSASFGLQTELSAVTAGRITQDKATVTAATVQSDQAVATSAQATASAGLSAALAAHQKVVDDLQNHVSPSQLAADNAAAASADKASKNWYDAWHTAETTFESDQKTAHDAAVTAGNELGTAITDALKREYAAQEQASTDHINDEKRLDSEASAAKVQGWRDETTEKQRQLDVQTKAAADALNEQEKGALAGIDSQAKAQIAALQAQIDAPAKAARAKQEQDLQAQTAAATGTQRTQLQAQLDAMLLQDHNDQLRAEQQTITDKATADKTALSAKYEDEKQAAAAAATTAKQTLTDSLNNRIQQEGKDEKNRQTAYDKELTDVKALYTAETQADALNQQARLLLEDGHQQDLLKLLATYYPEWKTAGQTFGQQLVDGLKSSGIEDHLNTALATINAAREATGLAPVTVHTATAGGGTGSATANHPTQIGRPTSAAAIQAQAPGAWVWDGTKWIAPVGTGQELGRAPDLREGTGVRSDVGIDASQAFRGRGQTATAGSAQAGGHPGWTDETGTYAWYPDVQLTGQGQRGAYMTAATYAQVQDGRLGNAAITGPSNSTSAAARNQAAETRQYQHDTALLAGQGAAPQATLPGGTGTAPGGAADITTGLAGIVAGLNRIATELHIEATFMLDGKEAASVIAKHTGFEQQQLTPLGGGLGGGM